MSSHSSVLEDLLSIIPDKWTFKDTTTRKWKRDLVTCILENDIKTVLEVGAAYGYTTFVVAPFVQKITGVEFSSNRLERAKALINQHPELQEKINFILSDVYREDWEKYDQHDLVIIDCLHLYDNVISDISNAITKSKAKFLAFDDYGLFPAVKKAVEHFIENGQLEIIKGLGEEPGTVFSMSRDSNTVPDKTLVDFEGIFCKVIQ